MGVRQVRWGSSSPFIAILVLLLIVDVASGVRQSHRKAIRNPNDFVTLYAGSICMMHECNPYSVPQLDSVLVSRRGTDVRQAWFDQLPIYPPTTLVVLLPFSVLSYRTATLVWYVLSLAVYIFGLCWVCFRSPFLRGAPLPARAAFALLGLYFPKMLQCLGFGNPSVMVTGLMLFAVFDGSERRRPLHVIAALLACFLKPPMAIFVAVVMLLREWRNWRETSKAVALCAAAFVLIGACSYIPGGMRHWPSDLTANIALGQQGGMSPENRVSPSNVLLNVANIPGYFTSNYAIIQAVVIAVAAPLFVLFAIALYRMRNGSRWGERSYLAAIATGAALTLLPVYHRFCDIGILLLVAPWVIREIHRGARWQAIISLPILGALYFSWERRIHLDRFSGTGLKLIQFLYYRGDAVLVLVLACVLLSAMFDETKAEALTA